MTGPDMDRIAPTRRPSGPAMGYQRWRSLLFLHWSVPVAALRPLVPRDLDLDLWDGQAYVGVVPFAMEGVRPAWCPERLAFQFLETNVRTYVSHRGRPGVYFFSLEAASRIAVWTARLVWGLPYYQAAMSMTRNNERVSYATRRRGSGASHRVEYRIGDWLGPAAPGTLEFYLLERYLLFVARRGRLDCGQVHHSPYPAQRATVEQVHDELVAAAGLPPVDRLPDWVHYAAGVDVEIFPLQVVGTDSRSA